MKMAYRSFTLVELLVVASVVVLLFALLVPMIRSAADEDARRACNSNLSQIAKACVTYQEPNGDFFPACSQYFSGKADDFKPMPSLATLYPAYIYDAKYFGCPATTDKPFISYRYHEGNRWSCFGTDEIGRPASNPARYSGLELSTELKCSYFYDERLDFRSVGPGQATACDADGQSWLTTGNGPVYPANWTRAPRKPNHPDGGNVMYFDGHVKWLERGLGGGATQAKPFCPPGSLEKGPSNPGDYLWDGVNAIVIAAAGR
jgi:prepilin-type processing-associated H-X9-DG protein